MGNIFNKNKPNNNDNLTQLLLSDSDNSIEKIVSIENNITVLNTKYNNIVTSYTDTINLIRSEMLNVIIRIMN